MLTNATPLFHVGIEKVRWPNTARKYILFMTVASTTVDSFDYSGDGPTTMKMPKYHSSGLF